MEEDFHCRRIVLSDSDFSPRSSVNPRGSIVGLSDAPESHAHEAPVEAPASEGGDGPVPRSSHHRTGARCRLTGTCKDRTNNNENRPHNLFRLSRFQ
jgi:hypothetical protein